MKQRKVIPHKVNKVIEPSGDVYKEAVKLVLDNKVNFMVKDNKDNIYEGRLISIWFIVNGHSVRLFDEKIKTKQIIHKAMCDCTRASLINTKYATVCVHIKAAELYLMLDIAKNMWGGDVLFADRLKYNREKAREAIGDYDKHITCPSCGYFKEETTPEEL
jgi:hypothetical protein